MALTVTADDLDAAIAAVVPALRTAAGSDWTVPAGTLEWDCWHTAEHIGDCLLSYAAQLAVRPTARYVRFLASADKDASAAEVLEFAEAGARILAASVRGAPPGARAFHPTGMADPAGFAAMGCAEMLLHGHDIAQGLGLTLDPGPGLCGRVLARLFPGVAAELTGPAAGTSPWQSLLWAAGRADLPGHPRPRRWRWQGAPPGE